jgi:hypothetical protein
MKQNLPTETAQPVIKKKRRGSQRCKNIGPLRPCDSAGAGAPPPAPLPCAAQVPGPEVPASSGETEGLEGRRPAATDYLRSFLAAWLALALLATGCVGPAPLKGGKAVTTRKPAGVVEQTLVQGENPSQATKQDQDSVKVRSYILPAGSRMEESRGQAVSPGAPLTNLYAVVLSAAMPVLEREEIHARTELGAAQKDTARELGARLSSLKGIVWVGVGLFVFGLASLVWPPLKVIIGSVTTSAALTLGGVALMVLPSLIVGNELLILGVVGVAVGGWFLAHRHGHLRGIVAASTGAQSIALPQAGQSDALRSGGVVAGTAPSSPSSGS